MIDIRLNLVPFCVSGQLDVISPENGGDINEDSAVRKLLPDAQTSSEPVCTVSLLQKNFFSYNTRLRYADGWHLPVRGYRPGSIHSDHLSPSTSRGGMYRSQGR